MHTKELKGKTLRANEAIALSIEDAVVLANTSRSELYEEIRAGRLKAKKRGRRTLILIGDLHDYLEALPDYQAREARSC